VVPGITNSVTLIPVKLVIRRRIITEQITPISPIKALVKEVEAAAAFFGSPPAEKYLKPAEMNITKKTRPAKKTTN